MRATLNPASGEAAPGGNPAPAEMVPNRELLRLNIGSGRERLPRFLSVDNNTGAGHVDVVHDLNRLPWPFEESSVWEVVMDHSLEHLEDTMGVIQELYRICADGARIEIRVPHFSCAWFHPGHRRAIGVGLFDHFDPREPEHYGNCRFRVERVRMHWMRARYRTNLLRKAVSAALSGLANLNPRVCQRIWCYWVGGFDEIEFRVRVVKPTSPPREVVG